MEKEIDIRKIMELLPHRYPFLLVDRILDIEPGESIIALKNVTMNEPFFQGHFPKVPVMPGVLIVEAMAQAGGVLFFSSIDTGKQRDLIYFMSMDKVRFRKPVVPGDQLILEVKILKKRSNAIKMAGIAKVGDKLVAEAQLMATVGE
jgi:3-hydroxyacyl-[acyl-carrier-protein] dehydratase